jgi:hypothetical protein
MVVTNKIYIDYGKRIDCPFCNKNIRRMDRNRHFKKEHNSSVDLIKLKKKYDFLIECGRYPVYCDCGCGSELNLSTVADKNRKVLKLPLSSLLSKKSIGIKYYLQGHRERHKKKSG